MKIYDAYESLTDAGKRNAIQTVCAALRANGEPISDEYIKQVMLGLRATPCGESVARAISAHFVGYCQMQVSPQEVVPFKGKRHASAR